MAIVTAKWDKAGLATLQPGPFMRAAGRALRKAGSTALRDMRSEAPKRIIQRKRIKSKYISRAIKLRRSGTGIEGMSWAVNVSGETGAEHDPVDRVASTYRIQSVPRCQRQECTSAWSANLARPMPRSS